MRTGRLENVPPTIDALALGRILGVSTQTIYYRTKVGHLPRPRISFDRTGRQRHIWTMKRLNRFFS